MKRLLSALVFGGVLFVASDAFAQACNYDGLYWALNSQPATEEGLAAWQEQIPTISPNCYNWEYEALATSLWNYYASVGGQPTAAGVHGFLLNWLWSAHLAYNLIQPAEEPPIALEATLSQSWKRSP